QNAADASMEKGIALAYLTAFVSGISVFANSFGVLTLDPLAYAFVRNILVASIIFSLALAWGSWREITSLNKKQLLMLLFIGLVGGGLAFALFFTGLSQISGAYGSFIYRLLFVFAAIIGISAFKEKPSLHLGAGVALVIAGNFVLLGSESITMSFGALLVLAATVLWAAEYAVSKKALESLSLTTVVSARMGIGSLLLLVFLLAQGKAESIYSIGYESFGWIVLSVGLLTLFTTLWYSALKYASLSSATATLTLGGPISALLGAAFAGKSLALWQAGGLLLLATGAVFAVGFGQTVSAARWAGRKIGRLLRLS
ncbi:MAG: DMT family transporter, partial [Candidatus Anstonellaceae archaeon]